MSGGLGKLPEWTTSSNTMTSRQWRISESAIGKSARIFFVSQTITDCQIYGNTSPSEIFMDVSQIRRHIYVYSVVVLDFRRENLLRRCP